MAVVLVIAELTQVELRIFRSVAKDAQVMQ